MIGKLENRNVKMCNMLQWAVVLITWNQPHYPSALHVVSLISPRHLSIYHIIAKPTTISQYCRSLVF